MITQPLEGPLDVLRQQEINLTGDIAAALNEMGDEAQADRVRLLDVAQDLREMFYLVAVIGEFNAGKSTFVNALLRDELLPIGVTPTTEVIELIRYSETKNPKPIMRSESLREWSHPNTGAPGVAIVDTPGTGSVFQKHESVAKDFLHRSDLVIFVISAKRAFAETERLYLEMAKNFGKKIIIVINQADLLSPDELNQVKRFVQQQVRELLNIQPLIFPVSAKEALRSAKDGTTDESGMDAIRAHLRGVFSEAPPAKQKLLSQLSLVQHITKKHYDEQQQRVNLIGNDTAKVQQVKEELSSQTGSLDNQLRAARAEIDQVFEGIRQRGVNFINTNLSVKIVGTSPSREKLQSEFQDVVIGRATRDVAEATNGYVNAVVDNSRAYWRSVIDRLNQLQEVIEQDQPELTGLDAGVYSQQREELQDAIRIAETELKSYSTGAIVGDLQQNFENNLNNFRTSVLAAFSGLIVLILAASSILPGGLALSPLAPIALVAAAPIALGGAYFGLRQYQRMTVNTKKEFNDKVDQLKSTYHAALDDLTRKERTRLGNYGTQVLTPIFSRLEALQTRYNESLSRFKTFLDRIEALRGNIDNAR
jgi:small GTP-binding protein